MSVFTISADSLIRVKFDASSAWETDGADQGMWTDDGTYRTGHIRFPEALREIDWGAQSVSAIRMTFTFARAGYSRAKTISLHRSLFDAATGHTGGEVRGAAIGQFPSNGRAYDATTTVEFSEGSNPEVFAALVEWLQQDSVRSLVTYIDGEPEPTYNFTINYLRIKSLDMEITYEIAGSGGSLDRDRLDAGETISLTIDPLDADGAVTHRVAWNLGQASSGVTDLGSALTASWQVPLEWLYQIPDAPSGEARCLLTTFVDGAEKATRTLPFTVDTPVSAAPVFDAVTEPSGTTGGYYQYLGGATVSAQGAVALYGAEIASVQITGSEGVSSDLPSVTTPVFAQAGEHSYTIIVTDTRGMATVQTAIIDVNALAEPVISVFAVRRYSSYVDDDGNTVYRDSVSGGKVRVTIEASIDAAGGNNAPNAYIVYESAVSTFAAQNTIALNWPEGSPDLILTGDRTVITADVPLNSAYEFTLVVEDLHSSVTAGARVEKSEVPLHIAGTGYGVGLGGYSNGTQLQPEVRLYWPLYGMDGYRLDGATEETVTTFAGTFTAYSEDMQPVAMRVGRLVQLSGACKTTSTIAGSITEYELFTLPKDFRPARDVYQVCQGGTTRIWLLHVNTLGQVFFSRYRYSSSYDSLSAGSQLLLNAIWIAGDSDKAVNVRYPSAAMTANSSQSCVVSASSTYSSTYSAWKAFDYKETTSWASDADDVAPWIQIQTPNALKNIVVSVYARDSKNHANPVSGTVLGSPDGSAWTQIGSFSGWDPAQEGGLLGEITCENETACPYIRLAVTEKADEGYTYTAIGYISVSGELEA